MSKLFEQINKENKKYQLGDFAILNPQVSLEKGKVYPFLDMSEVQPLERIPKLENMKIFNGSGAKFLEGDTLFARITPCLENGKITRILNLKQPAFGSTEFIVLREKDGISDNNFLYYLCRTYKVRKKAEQSMIGASGRQRVEKTAFENIVINAPSLPTQKKIASILGAYDEKIENNNKIIKNLEETAQTIFNEWFVSFKFPGYGKVKMINSEMGEIPEGWNIGNIETICKRLPSGKVFKEDGVLINGNVPVYDQSSKGIIGYHNEEPAFNASLEKPILIFGDHTCRSQIVCEPFSLGPNTIPLEEKDNYNPIFSYFLTKGLIEQREYKRHWNELVSNNFIIPDVNLVNKFIKLVHPVMAKIIFNEKENISLKSQRDLLLSKLI